GNDNVCEERQVAPRQLFDMWQELWRNDQHASTRVVQDVEIVRRLPQRVDRNRHGAGLDRPEEGICKSWRVEEQQHDALFETNIEPLAERVPEPVDTLQHLPVGYTFAAALNRNLAAPSFANVAV